MTPTPEVWTLSSFLGAAFEPADPIVEGLLHKGELVLISATAKTGKSILAANLALQVADGGEPFLGQFAVTKTKVLIIQTEISRHAYQQRLWKMIEPHGRNVPIIQNLLICDTRTKIDEKDGRATLENLIKTHGPGCLILDPFYTLHSKDEDRASEISPILVWLKQLVHKYNFGCLLVHHQGKRGEIDSRQVGHRHRGSSALADVPDGSISFQKSSAEKQATISFELRNHEAPPTLTLSVNENLWWRNLGLTGPQGRAVYSIEDLLEANESIPKATWIKRFEDKYKKKTRTAEEFMGLMISSGRLIRTPHHDDGTVWLSRAELVGTLANSQNPIETASYELKTEDGEPYA